MKKEDPSMRFAYAFEDEEDSNVSEPKLDRLLI
jgi:hypothetical protein